MGQKVQEKERLFYEQSLLHEQRFNLVAAAAVELQQREVALAKAGLVTASTAVRAGRKMQARYVILATMTRGSDDAECYVRLVNCETGKVVATADAYDRFCDDCTAKYFFDAVAGRLRQAFPIHQGRISTENGTSILNLGHADGVVENLRFYVIADQRNLQAARQIEVVSCRAHESTIHWLADTLPTAIAISE
jgi:hypothetical protein